MHVGLARVSNREQAENSHALEQQIDRLHRENLDRLYCDVQSGRSGDRPGLNKLLADIKKGEIKSVTVTRLDRFARMPPQKLWKILTLFEEHGVALRALDQHLDTETAAGRLQINILASMASFYSDDLSERVRHGWSHLRDRKVAVNPPFGYLKDADTEKHILDHRPFLCRLDTREEETRSQIARAIIDAFLEGRSLFSCLKIINERYGIYNFVHVDKSGNKVKGRVCRDMFRFSRTGLRAFLLNPILCGHLGYLRKQKHRTIVIRDTHPDEAIMTDDEQAEILSILSENRQRRGWGFGAKKFALSGMAVCGECRKSAYVSRGSTLKSGYTVYYFQCGNYPMRACTNKKMVRLDAIEPMVDRVLRERAEAIAALASEPIEDRQKSPELIKVEDEIKMLKSIPNASGAIQIAIADLQQKAASLQVEQQESDRTEEDLRLKLVAAFSDPALWENLTTEERRRIYQLFVEKVSISHGDVQIFLNV